MTINIQPDAFNLAQTLECGQFFQYRKDGDGYFVLSSGRRAFISQKGDELNIDDGSDQNSEDFWRTLLDLDRDYAAIKEKLIKNDPIMKEAAGFAPGIRIMNQDPWECLLGFVISQNNRIPMIMKTLGNISRRFGNGFPGTDDYSPPSPSVLSLAEESQVLECKAGFRAKYILDAARMVSSGTVSLSVQGNTEANTEAQELRAALMSIKGVGVKVSDCVMLFSMGRREVFPIDVWIARIMRRLYFDGREAPLKEIQAFAAERFGNLAGYAQQYLFHYARLNKIG